VRRVEACVTTRVPVPKLSPGEHTLGVEIARYLGRVHRLRAGDPFVAFDPAAGIESDGIVLSVAPGELRARFGALREARLVAKRDVTWVQALPKGEKMDAIVRDATELGVTRIVPVISDLTVVKLEGPRRLLKRERWERIAREAARQCGRSDAPEVCAVRSWAEGLAVATGAGFCLYERATAPMGPPLAVALDEGAPIVFAAGPEGGIAPAEVEAARERGFLVVSLGAFVLRSETVAASTLGALRVLEGALSA
jgi:16S rRNA (uracil1498-N3)-methyltransferase